jgi:protein SCO1/2
MKDKLSFLYIAIDPERDAPQRVAAYFDRRDVNFTSLHGRNIRDLQKVAMAYKDYFFRQGSIQRRDYEVDHNGFYYLIGPDGNIRFTYSASQNRAHSVLQDLLRIKNEYELS